MADILSKIYPFPFPDDPFHFLTRWDIATLASSVLDVFCDYGKLIGFPMVRPLRIITLDFHEKKSNEAFSFFEKHYKVI